MKSIKIEPGEFHLLLKDLREEEGMTIRDAAEALTGDKDTPNAWARYEQPNAKPTVQKMVDLLAVLGYWLTLEVKKK